MKQNQDYELVPAGDDQWHVRILTGDFVETIIRYGQLRYHEEDDNIHFDFFVTKSPDPDATENNVDLQLRAAQILESLLETAAEEGNLIASDPNESWTTINDPKKPIDQWTLHA